MFELVVIDYLQLMSSRGANENRNQEVSALSRGLKLMSRISTCRSCAFAIESRVRNSSGRSQAAIERPARFGIDRAGRRPGRVYLREEVYKKDREDIKGWRI